MLHRTLQRLDEAASTLVPLLYLAGLMLGAIAYFAGVTLDAGLAVGVALAAAAELHSFLQQRRLRAAWASLQCLPDEAPERESVWLRVKVNAAILAALLAFSAFNATAFAAETWRPAPGFLPAWLQIGLRGLVIPAFFFLAGFLSPLTTDASDQLRATSSEMLRRTLRAVGKQWQARLKAAQRRHADLAPIAVALMLDAGDTDGARRVELIAAGLATSEGRQNHHTATQEGAGVALPGGADRLPIPSGAPDDGSDDSGDDPSGPDGGMPSPDLADAARAPSRSTPAPILITRASRRPKPAAIRRRDRAAADALDEKRRALAWAALDADATTTANAIAKQLHCGHRTAKRYIAAWHRTQLQQRAAK